MSDVHHAFAATQYGPRAGDYLSSLVHATGADLDFIEAAVRSRTEARALDLGCGGGHVSYRIAPHVAEVIAVDPTAEMVETVRRSASERGLSNIQVQRSGAEQLPFERGRFDFVLCRFSAHHWYDFEAGLREARRVLAPQGRAIFIDTLAPASPLLDTHLQAMELLRDASHVRNYTASEWMSALARAGFDVAALHPRRLLMEFSSWIARTRTPALHAEAIRSLQRSAPEEVRTRLEIRPDGSFMLDAMLFEAVPT